MLEIIFGAPATASDVLDPEVLQVRVRPLTPSRKKSQLSAPSMRRIPSKFKTVAISMMDPWKEDAAVAEL